MQPTSQSLTCALFVRLLQGKLCTGMMLYDNDAFLPGSRGPGDFLGKKQSGRDAFSSLKAARLPGDRQLLEEARRTAAALCANWRDGDAEPPAPLLAAVQRQARALLDINQLSLPSAVETALDAL